QNEAVFGVRYHEESIDRKKYEFEDSFSDPPEGDERLKVKVRAVAAYAQNTFLHGNWTVTPGIRFERITYDKSLYGGDALDELDENLNSSTRMLLTSISATWNLLTSTTIFAGIHRGFVLPRPDLDVSDSGIVPTHPEISVTSEIGVPTSYFRAGNAEGTLF